MTKNLDLIIENIEGALTDLEPKHRTAIKRYYGVAMDNYTSYKGVAAYLWNSRAKKYGVTRMSARAIILQACEKLQYAVSLQMLMLYGHNLKAKEFEKALSTFRLGKEKFIPRGIVNLGVEK